MVAYTGASVNQGAVMGKNDVPYVIPESWITSVIRYRARKFNLGLQTKVAPFNGNKGDRIRMPYIGRLKTRKKTAGSPFIFEARKEGELKMIVDRYTYSGFSIDRKVDLQSSIALGPEYTKSIADALAEEIEYSLLAERATFISYDPANNRIQSNAPISFADMLTAHGRALELDTDPGMWTWNVGPAQYTTMFNIEQFVKNGVYNSGNVASIPNGAVVGTILGSPVVLNQSIRRNGSDQLNLGGFDYQDFTSADVVVTATPGYAGSEYLPTQYGSDRWVFPNGIDTFVGENYHSAILLHKEAISMAVQLAPEMRAWYSEDYGESRFLGSQLYDIKVQNPQLGIVIETDEDNLIA